MLLASFVSSIRLKNLDCVNLTPLISQVATSLDGRKL